MKNCFVTLFIFTVTFLVNSLILIEAFECPLSAGFFEDPEDPHYYYQCIANRAYHFECSGDLVFNVDIKQCDWSTPDRTRKPITTSTTETPGSTEEPVIRTRHTSDPSDSTTVAIVNTESSSPTTVATSTTPQSTTITTDGPTRGRHESSTAPP